MKSATPKKNDLLKDVPLDDKYSHIFVEYNSQVASLNSLKETIEMTGAQILDTTILREEPAGNKSILIKLDIQDVREVILSLLKYNLIRIEGYNLIVKRIDQS
jgi:hypothetical protein